MNTFSFLNIVIDNRKIGTTEFCSNENDMIALLLYYY